MNDEVPEDAKDAKRGNVNRVVCGGVDGESDSTEAVVFEWVHKIFNWIPLIASVELVFRREPGRVPSTARVKDRLVSDDEEYYSYYCLLQLLAYDLAVRDK